MCAYRAPISTDDLGEMREWLDRNSHPLVRFETEASGDIVTIKVRFDADCRPRRHGLYSRLFRGR